MITKTKTIKMLLYDGSLDGVTNISDSAWESGKMYSAPRESINKLVTRADCKKYGVYLLLSDKQVYVGQAIDLERRTKQHLADKDWWTQVVLMTTKDDSFNSSDIDYLEARLISLAVSAGTSDTDNKKKGNRQKVDEFRQAELEQYLDEALFLSELIGVKVFKRKKLKYAKSIELIPSAGSDGENEATTKKPQLPDDNMGPCEYAKSALVHLLGAGYVFTDEQMQVFGSADGSKTFTKRKLPMFWILHEGESRKTCKKEIRSRYWKTEFESGEYRFLMYSQWYDDPKKGATKEDFSRWYKSL